MTNRKINSIKKERNSVIAAIILCLIFFSLLCVSIEETEIGGLFHDICVMTREFVGFTTVFCLLICIFLIFSKYGNIRFGGENARPEFSLFSWASCMTMAGLGIGIVFYCQEPLFHYYSNPYYGNVAGTQEQVAYSLTLFDWTFNAWGLYAVLGSIIAYFHYNKGRTLKLSSALPDKTPLWVKNIIDILMALGIVAGLTTSLGLGVSQLKGGIDYVFHINSNPYLMMGLIGLIAVWSVSSGLKRGVKWLSNLTTILIFIVLAIIVALAYYSLNLEKTFLGYSLEGIGNFFTNFISYNDYYNTATDEWGAGWAVFYQLWFAAWAAFVAIFVAKISKGRTIRQFVLAVIILPSILTAIWYGIFGNIGLSIKDELFTLMQDNLPQSLFMMLNKLGGDSLYVVLSLIVMITICFIFITSSDSSSFVVAQILSNDDNVRGRIKMSWGIVQCVSAMVLYYCGGLKLIQIASVTLGLAVLVLIIIGAVYFLRSIISGHK